MSGTGGDVFVVIGLLGLLSEELLILSLWGSCIQLRIVGGLLRLHEEVLLERLILGPNLGARHSLVLRLPHHGLLLLFEAVHLLGVIVV